MNEQKLIKLLESHKSDPRLGGEFDFDTSWSRIAGDLGFEETAQYPSYGMRDYLEYHMWNFSHAMLKPMAAAVAVFLFAITGWITMANASQNTLPGDNLYPVKISVEKAQMILAFSSDQRAGLQIEFTSRRLDEMVEVSARLHESEPEAVRLAVDRFKSEVANIQVELTTQGTNTELAKAVGRKVEGYSSAVTAPSAELSQEVIDEVEEVIEEAKEQAVQVIITSHEADQNEDAARELEITFEKELALALEAGADEETLAAAQALADEGAYRRAFQVLKEFNLLIQE